jgi:Fibroblast growth factor
MKLHIKMVLLTSIILPLVVASIITSVPGVPVTNFKSLYVNHRYLQMDKNGKVNGTDKVNDNSLWQIIAHKSSKNLIRSVRYCKVLCINECGNTYTSEIPTSECLLTIIDKNFQYLTKEFNNKRSFLMLSNKGKLLHNLFKNTQEIPSNAELMFIETPSTIKNTCPSLDTTHLETIPRKTCKLNEDYTDGENDFKSDVESVVQKLLHNTSSSSIFIQNNYYVNKCYY